MNLQLRVVHLQIFFCITEDVKEVNTKLECKPTTSSHAQFEAEPEPIMTKKPGTTPGTGGRPLKHNNSLVLLQIQSII